MNSVDKRITNFILHLKFYIMRIEIILNEEFLIEKEEVR